MFLKPVNEFGAAHATGGEFGLADAVVPEPGEVTR
jgi:hypothetical protein